mmetsp:Transcript_13465/g.38717  ORF Transcript_13465/g.38717 Transcript_13465/m.38717 type:complete len:81 (-) Transcript_13465:461-703(-)
MFLPTNDAFTGLAAPNEDVLSATAAATGPDGIAAEAEAPTVSDTTSDIDDCELGEFLLQALDGVDGSIMPMIDEAAVYEI